MTAVFSKLKGKTEGTFKSWWTSLKFWLIYIELRIDGLVVTIPSISARTNSLQELVEFHKVLANLYRV